jgi:hypothetical protein
MSNTVALAVLAGVASAALFLSLSFGLPGMVLLSYFVQLPLLLVGLTLGLTPALIATVGAGVVSGLVAGGLAALTFAVVVGLPALVVVRQALLMRTDGNAVEWYPPGPLLAQMTALAAAAVLIAFLLFAGEEGGLVGAIEGFLGEALGELGAGGAGVELAGAVRQSAALFPGIMAASWLLMVVVNAVLAQALAVRLGRNLRPTPDIARLTLPRWLMFGTAAAALLSLIGGGGGGLGFLGGSLLVLFLVPYLFQGLAVAHAFARRWNLPRFALVAFYVMLVLLGWPALLIVILGLVEDWAHLRRRST